MPGCGCVSCTQNSTREGFLIADRVIRRKDEQQGLAPLCNGLERSNSDRRCRIAPHRCEDQRGLGLRSAGEFSLDGLGMEAIRHDDRWVH